MTPENSRTIRCQPEQQDLLSKRLETLATKTFEVVGVDSRLISNAVRRYQFVADGQSIKVDFDEGLLAYLKDFKGVQPPKVGSAAEFEQALAEMEDFVQKHPYVPPSRN